MSVWNRLFGRSKSSGAARKSGAGNARLGLESLEVREVPAVAGVPASPGAFPYQVSVRHAAADSVPTDQLALNFTKITFESKPQAAAASDYLLELHGIKGESADGHGVQAPASDYLLVLDGVHGESRAAAGHREQIYVESYSWGGASPGSSNTPSADDVWVDGKIITGENNDSAGIAVHGYIRIKKLNSGG